MAIDRNKGVQWACAPNVNVSIFAKGANVVGGSWGSVYRGPFGSGMVKQLKDWDYGESNEVVTKEAFGRDSTVYEKGEYVLVYNLKLDNSISLYRKGE